MRSLERVLSLGLAVVLAAGGVSAETVEVRVDAANVRSGPTTTAPVVGSVKRGDALELLESQGSWLRIRSPQGVAGWIASRLVEPVAQPMAPAKAMAPPPAAVPQAPSAQAGVEIDHKAVGCIVAEQYPRLEACFAPNETLGRAQIQFRASGTGPWYAVDMKADGPCYSAWLPKPKKETTSIDYFVFAVDKGFAESQRPEKAPGEPYQPRVVGKKADCDPLKTLAAWSAKTAPRILVNVVRDAGGKVLDAAAAAGQAAGAPAGVAGFSSDGVVMGNGASSGSASSTASKGTAASHGIPIIAVVGGAVAAGGLVAVVAGGGGGDGGSTGSSSSGSGNTSTSPSTQSLSGAWAGSAANGGGWTGHIFVTGGDCTFADDVTGNLVQSGNTLSGPITTMLRSFTCNPSDVGTVVNQLVPNFLGSTGGGTLMATLSPPGGISMPLGDGMNLTGNLTGTYTSTHIHVTGHAAQTEFTADYVLDISKR